MHPILARPARVALYIAVWVAFGLLLAGVLIVGEKAPLYWALQFSVPLALLLGFQVLSCWYMMQSLPARETPWPRLIGTWFASAVVVIAIWLGIGLWWASYTLPPDIDQQFGDVPYKVSPLLVLLGLIAYSMAILSHYLVAAFEHSRNSERSALESQVHAREAELKSLRAQLDPHFLFNSLNSVAALIGSDPPAARRMCYLMSSFFRKSISLGREPAIALSAEIDLIETFLSIEAVRFGERLRTKIEVADDAKGLSVPPLVLQPLVENAVHHGIAHLLEGGEIKVTARKRDGLLELAVENPFETDRPPSRGAGVGLNNVRSRIDTLYGNRGRVDAIAQGTNFQVVVLMPAIPLEAPQSVK
jgi:two-component system sensor histidine kinase AlgZ